MNYLKHYCNLIRKAENRTPPEGYTEKHHIFPVSIFGKNNRIVVLTGREHYIAHVLLEKICSKRYGVNHHKTFKMNNAHISMKRNGCYNSYLYENAKVRRSVLMIGNKYCLNKKHSEETKRKIGKANRGQTRSEETKRKMSEALKGENNPNYGKSASEETRRKISEANRGIKNGNSKKWKIKFNNFEEKIISCLSLWAKENGYNPYCLYDISQKRQKTHKNIILVELLTV